MSLALVRSTRVPRRLAPERQAELRRLAQRWCHFLRFIERERRLHDGERLIRLVHDDDGR